MKVLAVDTSTAVATAAIIEEDKLLCESVLNSNRAHSQKLMGLIDELFMRAGLTPADMDFFACSAGPGSFTGLRIGASITKAMAQVLKKPIAAVPTLDALAFNLFNCSGAVCPILDAQRGMVYSALYAWEKGELVKRQDFRAILLKDLLQYINDEGLSITFLGDAVSLHADEIREAIPHSFFAPPSLLLPRASSVAALALQLHAKGQVESYDAFKLTYIRKSQAEVEYEKKQKAVIGEMSAEDIDAICEIEQLCFESPWSRESFEKELYDNKLAKYVVARVDGKVIGYGGMWVIFDEGHITNIAVHPDYRGRRIGEKILEAMMDTAKKNKVENVTLEVRTSNLAARNLYKKFGFADAGIRKGYYADNGEDAVIMWSHI